MGPSRVLVALCPWWPLLAAGFAGSDPAVVVQANRVTVASPRARALGIAPGMRRREAEGRLPQLVTVNPDPARDAREFEAILSALDNFTPHIEVCEPGTCLFATRSCARYFGGEPALTAQVSAAVDARGGRGSFGVGVADGLFAAEVAALQSLGTGPRFSCRPGSPPGTWHPSRSGCWQTPNCVGCWSAWDSRPWGHSFSSPHPMSSLVSAPRD